MTVKYGKAVYVVEITKTENTPVMVMVKTHDQRKIISGSIKNGAYCPSALERRIVNAAIRDGLLVGFAAPAGYNDPYSSVKYRAV